VPPEEETDAGSEASKWELRERREREEGSEAEVQALGAEGGTPLFLPTPSFMQRSPLQHSHHCFAKTLSACRVPIR